MSRVQTRFPLAAAVQRCGGERSIMSGDLPAMPISLRGTNVPRAMCRPMKQESIQRAMFAGTPAQLTLFEF